MKFFNRYLERLLSDPDNTHPETLSRQWTRDIHQLMAFMAIPGLVFISALLLMGIFRFSDMFPIYILFALLPGFWVISRGNHWQWARPFPALICFFLGTYGLYSLGMHFNISLYLALAVLLGGLLQGVHGGLIYVILGTASSVLFGVVFSNHPDGFGSTASILMNVLTTFFCLAAAFLIEWYLKNRLESLIAIEVENNRSLKEEIRLRHDAEAAQADQKEQLRLSEEKFSKAFLISPDSVNINRLSDGLYIDINQGFTKILGYTREDVMGKSSLDLSIWADPADRARLVKNLRETGEVNNLEAKFTRKDGGTVTGLMSARLMEINGETCLLNITRDISERKMQEEALLAAHIDLEKAYESTLRGWVKALEMKEKETANHSRRVVELTLQIAADLKIDANEMIHIQRGALLHDIGKMAVPDNILLKPGPLDEEEWKIMRLHPQYAHTLLSGIPYLVPAIDIPYCHHEKWDGSGYPRGLKGEEIPLAARIFAMVDVYDALTSPRPYRPAWDDEKAISYIRGQVGIQFDPALFDPFMAVNKSL